MAVRMRAGGPEVGTVPGAVRTGRAAIARTGPADRARAEAGVWAVYRAAGLTPPARMVWAASPLAGARMVTDGTADGTMGPPVLRRVHAAPWAAARERALRRLGPRGWAEHWGTTGAVLWDVAAALVGRVRAGVVEEMVGPDPSSEEEARAHTVLLEAVPVQRDAAWLTAFDPAGTDLELAGIAELAGSCGWWWPRTDAVVLTEPPVELHRDEAGRPDRADGPAVAWSDGFALHAWRGMPVPAEFLAGLEGLTADRIAGEENAELRRVMLEHFGYDRYLREVGARPVHRDERGTLWRIDLPDDEPVLMVEVVNSTPEPDGSHRVYWLRVPPRTSTAAEGVAWSFGVETAEYAPVAES
ncbi:DUF6745 domain-containing protein [Streptomyces sp. ST2-7A]|uniref:DUF6745 domain-containing protein n=1 Tax=Streptomyces sp. ST2-7A TaxID=2907214 RepID=UPI001F1A5FE2|nr:hypothetical protein [Streptomyces sp. ST2-7A]MCE7079295.1 hypothetical protein [Streptomyces sp. ST2-7A]